MGPWVWAIAEASEVTVSLDRFRDLVAPPALEPAPAPFVERRDVTVRRRGDEFVVEARFRVAVPEPGPVAFTVAGPQMRVERFTVDGRVTALGGGAGGPVFAAALSKSVELTLVGAVNADALATVSLLGAGAGELRLPPDLALVDGLRLGPGRWVPGAPDRTMDALVLQVSPPEPYDRGQLVFGRVGYGVTLLDGELRRSARLQWRVVSGSIDKVAFTVPGAGPDLVVEGTAVGEVVRAGDHVQVTLSGPESSIAEIRVHTSTALPAAESTTLDLGLPVLEGVFRSESTVVLARDGDLDVLPRLQGFEPQSVLRLPDVARGLIEGTPSAAFAGPSGSGSLDIFRYTPAEGPATLCDVATYTAAIADDGRSLIRAHFTVRNDRGHLLRITPPPGYEPISAAVSERVVTVSRDGDTWLVPLDKSVESVAGLLTFPVEIAFVGREATVGTRRLRRPLTLPTIDAQIAVVRATVHLPPGFVDRAKPGGDRVDAFTEGQGVTYGFALGDARASQAEGLFQEALKSWSGNSFDDAQVALDQIKAIGGSNDNTLALQGNLDLVSGKKQDAESSIDRRIKDQARARAISDFEEQRRLLEEADQASNEGRYDEAEAAYGAASAVTEKLANLANDEDVAQAEELEATWERSAKNVETMNRKMAYRSQAVVAEAPAKNAPKQEAKPVEPEEQWMPESSTSPVNPNIAGSYSEDFEESGVEGGVVGGVVAGVLGGVLNGAVAQPTTVVPPPPPPPPPTVVGGKSGHVGGLPGPRPPAIVATSASVIVPTDGEPVHFQHLLLPSGEALALPLEGRRSTRRTRSPR